MQAGQLRADPSPEREKHRGPQKGLPKPGPVIEKAWSYVADFLYFNEEGKLVVEDCKGCKKGAAYDLFVIKRKLMLYVHGIKIREI